MFTETIPAPVRALVAEHCSSWTCTTIAVGCSGNFAIERALLAASSALLIGGDTSLYSCALGSHAAGQDLPLRFNPEHQEPYGFVGSLMASPSDRLATVMLASGLPRYMGPANAYTARMLAGYQRQWPELHAETSKRIEASTLRLQAFHCAELEQWEPLVPPDAGLIVYPPPAQGTYEARLQARLESLFLWDAPAREELTGDRRLALFRRLCQRRHFLLGSPDRLPPEFDRWLCGLGQATNRSAPGWVYAAPARPRVILPHQPVDPPRVPHLGPDDVIDDRSVMALAPLSGAQFAALRSLYLDRQIKPAPPLGAWAVLLDGRLAGAFAVTLPQGGLNVPGRTPFPFFYLLSDFPVAHSRYPQLSKLVLVAACSREAQLLMERVRSSRIRGLLTTAFADRPVSMKYRGLFELIKRTEATSPERIQAQEGHRYMLQYGAALGRWTLAQGLADWRSHHAKTRSTP
jgi:hypothetical protein